MAKILSLLFVILAFESWVHSKESKATKKVKVPLKHAVHAQRCEGHQEYLGLAFSNDKLTCKGIFVD